MRPYSRTDCDQLPRELGRTTRCLLARGIQGDALPLTPASCGSRRGSGRSPRNSAGRWTAWGGSCLLEGVFTGRTEKAVVGCWPRKGLLLGLRMPPCERLLGLWRYRGLGGGQAPPRFGMIALTANTWLHYNDGARVRRALCAAGSHTSYEQPVYTEAFSPTQHIGSGGVV